MECAPQLQSRSIVYARAGCLYTSCQWPNESPGPDPPLRALQSRPFVTSDHLFSHLSTVSPVQPNSIARVQMFLSSFWSSPDVLIIIPSSRFTFPSSSCPKNTLRPHFPSPIVTVSASALVRSRGRRVVATCWTTCTISWISAALGKTRVINGTRT